LLKLFVKNFLLPKIYPVTDVSLSKLAHLEQVKKLIEGGATLIQLRDKRASPKDFYGAAKEVLKFARAKKVKIIINDRVDIALAVEADGVHLGQDDLSPEYARKILGEKAIVGFSTHTLAQAVESIKLPIDYVAIGPVFSTTTKKNAEAVVGLEGVKKAREAIGDFPLVAIGGINLENFQEVLDAGADSVAIISDLVSEADKITERLKEFYR